MPQRTTSFVAIICLLVLGCVDSVRAQTVVRGTPDAVQVEAVGAPLTEILSQLAAVNLRYEGTGVPARVVTGTYSGSLSQVLARLLDGTSYITQRKGDLTILRIVKADDGRVNSASAGAPAQPPRTQPANLGGRRSLIPESEL